MNDAVQVQVAHIELLLHTFSSLLLLLFHNMQQQKLMALPSGATLVVKRIQGLSISKTLCTVDCFPKFCFVVKTSADNVILQIFDKMTHDFSLFSTQLTLFRPKSSIGLKKDGIHVRKCQKFAKSHCRPTFLQRNKTSGNIRLCCVLEKTF